ncbi:MAG TPA: glutamine synthetase family protein [Anaeromyxobacteraceae bacterium]
MVRAESLDLDALRLVFEERKVTKVKLGGFDVDGVLRGKYVSLEKFFSAAQSGLGFCDVIFGWDVGDQLYDNAQVTGWHTGYPDTLATIDLSTFRMIPWEPGTAAFLLDFCDREGKPLAISPRQVLQRVLARAARSGLEAKLAAEYEFFFFKETPESVRAKGFTGLTPLSPGMFGYSWLRASESSELVHRIQDELAAFDLQIEGFHTETGPGVFEAAIAVDTGLRAADKAALFKTAVKEIAHRHGLMPCFMAKWNEKLPGCSGHVHLSLWDGQRNVFADGAGGMSRQMEHAIAGQVALMPELTGVVAPTVNSYKRMVEGAWAPTTATWGVENRTTALRAIPGSAKATRIEYRQAAADMNPYTAMAVAVGSALWGMERSLAPPPPVRGNAYDAKDAPRLPRTLAEATARLRESAAAREILGAEFVEHYARTREWEVRQFERAVTTWELERYFEII